MAKDSPSKPALFDYSREQVRIDQLISQWHEEDSAIKFRREARKKEVNVSEEQAKGTIGPDETLIARRIIDRNIRLEKPELVAYLEQSPRICLFKSLSDPTRDTIPLADWFTLGMRYQGWAEPWHRVIDATCLHGAAAIEVRYDVDRPFNISLEYTPRESLIFPLKLRKSIQKCEMVLRVYEYLPNELEDAVKAYGFNGEVVRHLVDNQKHANREIPIKVYKVFRKKDGIIYVGWYSPEAKQSTWLKSPEPLTFGLMTEDNKAKPVTIFPFFFYIYEFTEEEEIVAIKGRAAKDLADQDAMTQLWSAVVNGTTRAASIQASFKNDPANPDGQETKPIQSGQIQGKEVEFYNAPYPDPMILSVVQALSTENLQSAGKVDYAAQNRQDSRKTATEINSAKDQSVRLSSINILPLASVITNVYALVWQLVQQQVLYSLANKGAELVPVPIHIDPLNWTDNYEIAPAGDVEVLKRAEKMSNLQQDLPLFAGSPIYNGLLTKYLELRFPDEAVTWKAQLEQLNPLPLLAEFVNIISATPMANFTPEQQQQLQMTMQNAIAALSNQGGASPMASGSGNSGNAQPPQPQSSTSLSPSTSPIKGSANG
jgi:hypothetical protein